MRIFYFSQNFRTMAEKFTSIIYMNVTTEIFQTAITRLVSYNNFILYRADRFV